MKSRTAGTALLVVTLLISCGKQALLGAEVIDRVLAVAAGSLIMLSDVNAARDLGLVTVPSGADPIAVILPQLIDRALILSEVERYAPPEPDEQVVSSRLESVRRTFQSTEAFDRALARVGYDEKHLRETLRQDVRILAYLDQRFTVPLPSDADLNTYYQEHPDRFSLAGRPVTFDQARPQIAEALAAERRQRLVGDWVAGLRRRAEVIDLTAPLR